MATAQLIDLSNYDTLLVQSTQSRAGTPDGNVYFDKATGGFELIPVSELATVDLGSGAEANPLDTVLGIKFEAIYAFENQERAVDEDLRKYDRWTKGSFKFAGAYQFINSKAPSTTADRSIIRGSGWSEIAGDGGTNRILFGNKGLSNIEATSQPGYQLVEGGAVTSFSKVGQFDEAVQVFGSTGNTPTDATAGDFDTRTYEAVSVRTFGFNFDTKETTTDLGISELGAYSVGFAVNETPHLTSGNYTLADVYGGAQVAPWTGLSLEKLAVPQTETGFAEADADFTWVLSNTGDATLDEVVAFLDALGITDNDIDDGALTITNGQRNGTWYSYNATGQVVFDSPFAGEGLFVENIPTADEQRMIFTEDGGTTTSRPFTVGLSVDVGSIAKADPLAWFHSFFAAAYNTAGAITCENASSVEIKGLASTANGSNRLEDTFDFDGDTVGGTAGTDKDSVFLCEGDGGATQAKTLFTFTRSTTISFSCIPAVETNV